MVNFYSAYGKKLNCWKSDKNDIITDWAISILITWNSPSKEKFCVNFDTVIFKRDRVLQSYLCLHILCLL